MRPYYVKAGGEFSPAPPPQFFLESPWLDFEKARSLGLESPKPGGGGTLWVFNFQVDGLRKLKSLETLRQLS